MNHKVLLADDSLTIQKVIKITLANQPFAITDCSTDEDLFKKLPQIKPEIVFLDFNLSERYSGYELASKIKEIHPQAQILLLLGTFDTIDDAAMEKCGAADKIVKPFDSNKFISICKRLVDSAPFEEIKYPESKKEEFVVPNKDDEWTVSHTVEHKAVAPEPTKASFDVRNHLNPLDKEVSDWGLSVPGIISDRDAHEKTADIPSIIEDKKAAPSPVRAPFEIKFPETDDLDYPTIEELSQAPVVEAKPAPQSKLISIDSFTQDTGFEIEHSYNVEETDVSSIEAQIRDEVEDNLWKVDEFEDLKKEVAAKIEEVKNNFQPSVKDFDESLFKPLDAEEEIQWASVDTLKSEPQISSDEIEDLIKKHVKEYMDQMFQQKVEKIAWEIIPDLAENLIRQEMAKISHKILNESN